MPRQRLLKPGFFRNEDLGAFPPLTRLFFAGLWCWADREGRLEDRPRRLAAEILPYDRDADGEVMVAQLTNAGFLQRYESGGVRVIQVENFLRHQDVHPREARSLFPGPAEGGPKANPRRAKVVQSPACTSFPSFPSCTSLSPPRAGAREGSELSGLGALLSGDFAELRGAPYEPDEGDDAALVKLEAAGEDDARARWRAALAAAKPYRCDTLAQLVEPRVWNRFAGAAAPRAAASRFEQLRVTDFDPNWLDLRDQVLAARLKPDVLGRVRGELVDGELRLGAEDEAAAASFEHLREDLEALLRPHGVAHIRVGLLAAGGGT